MVRACWVVLVYTGYLGMQHSTEKRREETALLYLAFPCYFAFVIELCATSAV